ncbi:MAG TPA: response regulator [Desulfomonilaceae bacterium]|nr:response regulator [Desulfomonilaceae bacterium]
MSKARIMIVEDDGIIAKDMAVSLRDIGYEVSSVVARGEDAVKKAEEDRPDLVIMDVVLRGKMDGIEAADIIRARSKIPVVYLTAHADPETLERAKPTEPGGYLIKPFAEAELRSAIEMALYKYRLDMKLREGREWFSVTLNSIGDGLIATDRRGRVIFMNRVGQELTGYSDTEAQGKSLSEILTIRKEGEEISDPELIAKFLKEGREAPSRYSSCILEARDGSSIIVEACAAPIRNVHGETIGLVLVFHDITDLKKTEEALRASHKALAVHSATLEAKVKERTEELEKSRAELEVYSESLEKTNEALKIIIEGIEEQKQEIERKITQNLNLTVKPLLDQLKLQQLSDTASFLLQSLEFNLSNLFSSFGFNIVKNGHLLTPKEMRICEMIRSGLTSKQIAKVMNISPQTVLVHRKNIRKKLALAKSRSNLASFLKANS